MPIFFFVGWSDSGLGGYSYEAFICDDYNGMRTFKDLLVNYFGLDLTGWTLNDALGISDNGLTIIGYDTNPDGCTEAWVATVPEPSTLLLLGLGAVMLRRKR